MPKPTGSVVEFLDTIHGGPCLCGDGNALNTVRLSDLPRVTQRITCTAEYCPMLNPTWKRIWCNDLKS